MEGREGGQRGGLGMSSKELWGNGNRAGGRRGAPRDQQQGIAHPAAYPSSPSVTPVTSCSSCSCAGACLPAAAPVPPLGPPAAGRKPPAPVAARAARGVGAAPTLRPHFAGPAPVGGEPHGRSAPGEEARGCGGSPAAACVCAGEGRRGGGVTGQGRGVRVATNRWVVAANRLR